LEVFGSEASIWKLRFQKLPKRASKKLTPNP